MSGVQVGTVQTNGFSMDYLHFGRGEKALVILHGLSVESITKYAEVVALSFEALANDFDIYVIDRRTELPAAYSLDEMAEDTAKVMQALGLEGASLFGASQGAMMAMVIAAEHLELVGRLMLASTTARVDVTESDVFEEWIQLAERGDTVALYRAFGEAIYPKDHYEKTRPVLERAAEGVTKEELERFVILATSMIGFDARGRLGKISCPTLLTGSRDDRVIDPSAADEIAQLMSGNPDFEMHMYDAYGHASYDTAPDYRERMLCFLRG